MNGIKNNSNFINLLIFLFLFSVFLLPSFHIVEHLPNVRMDDFLLLIILTILAYNFKSDKNISTYLILIFTFLAWISVTILINIQNNYINSIYELYKLIKYILVFCFFYKYCLSEDLFRKLINIFFIFLIIFNVFQLYNVMNVNFNILKYYAGEGPIYNSFISDLVNYNRVFRLLGTMGNPNNNAILMSFFVIFYFINLSKFKKFKYFVLLLTSLVFFLLCNSRTALIALLFSFILYLISINKNILKIIIVFFLMLLFLMLIQKFEKLDYINSLFTLSFSENTSLMKRFEVWDYLFDMIKDSFIFGYGPYKNFFYSNSLYSENEYILMLWRYGVPGVILYLLELFIPLHQAFKNKSNYFSKIVFMFSIVILICGLTNNPMSEPRINVIYALISSLMFSEIKKNNEVYGNVQNVTD